MVGYFERQHEFKACKATPNNGVSAGNVWLVYRNDSNYPFRISGCVLIMYVKNKLVTKLESVNISLGSGAIQSVELTRLLITRLYACSVLSTLYFTCPLCLFSYDKSSALCNTTITVTFVPNMLTAPVNKVLTSEKERHRILITLNVTLVATLLLSVPVGHSLPLTIIMITVLNIRCNIRSLLGPVLRVRAIHVTNRRGIRQTATLISRIAVIDGVLNPIIKATICKYFNVSTLYAVTSMAFTVSTLLFNNMLGRGTSSRAVKSNTAHAAYQGSFQRSVQCLLRGTSLITIVLLTTILGLTLIKLAVNTPVVIAGRLKVRSSFIKVVRITVNLNNFINDNLINV